MTLENEEPLSAIVLNQRWRNYIIEYFGWVSSYQRQWEYQNKVPYVNVGNEAINQWADFADDDMLVEYVEPVFSPDEQTSMKNYRIVWKSVIEDTPGQINLKDAMGTEPWERLRSAAEQAFSVFMRRGLFDWNVSNFPSEGT